MVELYVANFLGYRIMMITKIKISGILIIHLPICRKSRTYNNIYHPYTFIFNEI